MKLVTGYLRISLHQTKKKNQNLKEAVALVIVEKSFV